MRVTDCSGTWPITNTSGAAIEVSLEKVISGTLAGRAWASTAVTSSRTQRAEDQLVAVADRAARRRVPAPVAVS